MVNFYVNRIQNNVMNIEEVPPLWREKVRAKLEELENRRR